MEKVLPLYFQNDKSMEFFATAANIAAHIEDSKKGDKTILLLHGYLETMYIWEDFYRELSRDYRVIRIDLPGHGLTCTAPVNTMEMMATVAKGVLDVCGVAKATVVGHSMGGYAAIHCCSLFPDRFEKLVLLNSHPYPESEEGVALRLREQEVVSGGKLMQLAELSIPRMFHPGSVPRLEENILEITELCDTHDPAGIVASIKGMVQRSDTSAFLASGKVPVLAICGDSDLIVTPEIRAKMAADCPGIRLEILPECGHNVILESPVRTLELLREFI